MSKRIRREFYLLPRGEQRALILLSLLLILSLLFRITVQSLPERKLEGMEAFEQQARLFMAALAETDSLQQTGRDTSEQKDPPRSPQVPSSIRRVNYSHVPSVIDINRADSVGLLPLPGIGPVFAGRIVKYRNLLGGFVHANQLLEVYGMSMETIETILDRIEIDTSAIIKLDLNRASFRELLRHPYLEYEDVLSLVKYRDFAGAIQSLRELQENYILADSVLQKVMPYLYSSNTEAFDLSK